MKLEAEQAKPEGPQDPAAAENWQAGKTLPKTHAAAPKSSLATASKTASTAIAIASSNLIQAHPKTAINTRTREDDLQFLQRWLQHEVQNRAHPSFRIL